MPFIEKIRSRTKFRVRSTLPSLLAGEGLGVRERAISLGNEVSSHARARMQQRGVTPAVIDLLDAYGATAYDHRGAAVRYFDKAARRKLRAAEGADVYRAVEAKLNVYAVVARDGCLVTVGRRDHRINRH